MLGDTITYSDCGDTTLSVFKIGGRGNWEHYKTFKSDKSFKAWINELKEFGITPVFKTKFVNTVNINFPKLEKQSKELYVVIVGYVFVPEI